MHSEIGFDVLPAYEEISSDRTGNPVILKVLMTPCLTSCSAEKEMRLMVVQHDGVCHISVLSNTGNWRCSKIHLKIVHGHFKEIKEGD